MKEYYCFVTDNDGHHYMIPVDQRTDFYNLLEDMESDETLDVVFMKRFNSFRCLHPSNYMFTERVTLKESK